MILKMGDCTSMGRLRFLLQALYCIQDWPLVQSQHTAFMVLLLHNITSLPVQVIALGIPFVIFPPFFNVLAVHHCTAHFHISPFFSYVAGMYLACAHIEYLL